MFETYDRLYQEYVRRAKSPQEELSRVAIQTLEGYFRSHPLPSERIEQIRELIADQHWGDLNHERDMEVAYIFWTERAQRAYEAGHYMEAAAWAKRSLDVHPDQPIALLTLTLTLANTQFALANFSEAALAFRKALEKRPYDDELMAGYGDALAAQHTPAQSLQQFEVWLAKYPELRWRLAVSVEWAGLTLAMRGEAAADGVLFPAVSPNAMSLPPELRGRYGWWFYRVGQFDLAGKLLQSAVEQLPGDPLLQTRLGWVLIEQHNLEAAIQRFSNYGYNPSAVYRAANRRAHLFQERRVGLAVAEWQAQQVDRAVSDFADASIAQPEWLNSQWVGALYSAGVAKTIEGLKAEQKKRFGPRARGNF